MSGIGAASFVEGLQGGIAARDKMDRNKQFKQMRGMEISGRRIQGEANQRELMGDDFDQAAFDEEWGTFEQGKDPALLRFGKWMGGKMGGMFGGKGEESATEQMGIATPEVQPVGLQKSGAKTFAAPGYADGGEVERMKRAYGEYYMDEEEAAANPHVFRGRGGRTASTPRTAGVQAIPTSGGGVKGALGDVGRATSDYFDDTQKAAHGADALFEEAHQGIADARGVRETMGAVRDAGSAYLTGGIESIAGVAKDLFVDNPVTQGALGFAGFDGKADAGIPTDVPSTPEGEAIGASTDQPDQTDEQVAQVAIKEASDDNIENFDYKLLVDQGVRPEELPSMTTKDWSGYRERMTMGAIMRGQSPLEAHQMVDERITQSQMAGFNREANKASLYLQSGQVREASMALRQAYQYFPNGVTVKFGTMNDPKTGQPVIITMGTDEETGEPTGKPTIITRDSLASMVEQATNPAAFRAWTKDGRDLQLEINKLQSIDDYRQGSLDIAGANAITNRMEAQADASGGGMTHSQKTASSKLYMSEMEKKGFMEDSDLADNPRMVEGLIGAMLRLEMGTGLPQGIIVEEVMAAYGEGGDAGAAAVQQLLENQTR